MNLAEMIDVNAARRPDHPAVVTADATITHAAYAGLVRRWAGALAARGIGVGDIVGVNLKDTVDHLAALYALARMGAVVMPVDWRWTTGEKMRIAGFFGARAVLSEPGDPFVAEGGGWANIVLDGSWREAVAAADAEGPPVASGDPPLVLSLSSGTTGTPKGPLVSHGQFLGRFMIYFATLGFNERTRYMSATPLYFGGNRGYAMCALYAGATVILMPPPYATEDLVARANACGATMLFLVPTLLRRVLALPPAADGSPLLGGLDLLFSTGAALHPEERAELMRRVSPRYINYYGSTDGGGATALAPDAPEEAASSVGRPVFGAWIEIVDEAHRPVQAGTVGRIRYRHAGTAIGYHNDPEASGEAFRDGWYYPGDLGRIDEAGYLHLAGRAKDMIIRGGVNIYPAEIEHVLALHPAVHETAVVGWPSREFGEEVAAFVVPHDDADRQADEHTLIAWCRERLAPYKIPRAVFVVDDLPRSGVGKVLKARLAERLEPL